jgi:hypothetical protein
LHRRANVVDKALDHRFVFALGHDSDQRFGPRLADDQAAAVAKLAFGPGDRLPDRLGLERLAAAEANVLEN